MGLLDTLGQISSALGGANQLFQNINRFGDLMTPNTQSGFVQQTPQEREMLKNMGIPSFPTMPQMNPILTGGFNPDAPQPVVMNTTMNTQPPMMVNQPPQQDSFAQRLQNFLPLVLDYQIGQNIAGAPSFDPRSGDPAYVRSMGLQNALQGLQNRRDAELKRKQQEFQNQQQLFQNKIAEQNFRINEINLQNTLNTNQVLKDINPQDFEDQQSFNFALGNKLIKTGNISQGLELIKASRPNSDKEFTKMVLSERKVVRKPYEKMNEVVSAYRTLRNALKARTGTGAYTAMIKYIKALDDSVVREGEVANFTRFQGLKESMIQGFRKNIEGKGFTEKIANDLLNQARLVTANAVTDYENNIENSNKVYNGLGLPADKIYGGFELRYDDLDLFEAEPLDFSVGDYETNEDEKKKAKETIGKIDGFDVKILNNAK